MTIEPGTIRTINKWIGPIVGFLVFAGTGFKPKGFILGIVAGLLSVHAAAVVLGLLSKLRSRHPNGLNAINLILVSNERRSKMLFRRFVTLCFILGLALVVSGSLVDPAVGETRYSVSSEGVIKDSQTGLEWLVGPDKGTSYYEAEAWVNGSKIAGGGWRMPTLAELKDLYGRGLDAPAFKTAGRFVWREREREGYVGMWDTLELNGGSGGGGSLIFCVNHGQCGDFRAFGVRSVKK